MLWRLDNVHLEYIITKVPPPSFSVPFNVVKISF